MKELNIIILLMYLFRISSCDVIVETNSGYIRSTASRSDDVEAFLGIPFAEPPVGDLRFAKPVPKRPWTEIYDASSLPPPCAQHPLTPTYFFTPDLTNMTEDCLYLNIWMPKAKVEEHLRPVIIYLHPGGFLYGSSNQKEFDGAHIASRGDVVVVTLNYRLGVLGFFLAYIEEADGNMGMYDQLMAIEWVRDNAKSFGGDPENIVLMGTSAGAISVGAHILSPLTKNLFGRVIILSGSILTPFLFDGNEKMFKNSAQVATLVGCMNETVSLEKNPKLVVDCLKRVPAKVLADTLIVLTKSKPVPFHYRTGDNFLPEDTLQMLREGRFSRDVDIMFGTTIDEGCLITYLALHGYTGKYGTLLPSLTKVTATAMFKTILFIAGIKKNISESINFYLKRYERGAGYVRMVTDLVGDLSIVCGSVFQADMLSLKGNSVYFYKFAFRPALTPMAEWVRATHVDDVQYIFGNPYYENFTAEEVALSNRFIARLSAFSRTGNPNVPGEVPWQRYAYHNPLYLYIGQEEESLRLKPWDRCDFWRKEFRSEIDENLERALYEPPPSYPNSASISSCGNSQVCFLACLFLAATYGLDFLRQLVSLTRII